MNTRKVIPGLADRLKAARAAAGLSQVQAGERARVHPVSIAKFETDKTVPTLDALYRLAAGYGVGVYALIPETVAQETEAQAKPRRSKKSA